MTKRRSYPTLILKQIIDQSRQRHPGVAIVIAGIEARIVKVTDDREIARHGILSTPGLVIDGQIRSYGRIPSAGDIATWLTEG